jgi:hypothetical protein
MIEQQATNVLRKLHELCHQVRIQLPHIPESIPEISAPFTFVKAFQALQTGAIVPLAARPRLLAIAAGVSSTLIARPKLLCQLK